MDISELENLAQKATPGPWRKVGKAQVALSPYHNMNRIDFNPSIDGNTNADICGHLNPYDPDYIAAANPSTILELIERIRSLENGAAPPRVDEVWG